jgi:hypothetical protein
MGLALLACLATISSHPATLPSPQMPAIVPRSGWNASPVLPHARRHEIRFITIHHTGVAQRPDQTLETKLKNLQTWSQREDKLWDGRTKPAWPDVPYHFYISTDGRIGEAREVIYTGDTNTEYDPTGHLLIVVEGTFDTEVPTPEQVVSLRALTLAMARVYGVAGDRIAGHNDYAVTGCPGWNLRMEVRKLAERVRRGQF